ncbi:hypothetical protein KAFR_0F01520 [Kazachstania africana CBS 2517]|uniref:Exocyst complex component Sec10-like alpha-helical bundle domain-containing protein n=1 Tax=Kazachstania africana (strain ATCC 22294 / BCRC 22015 / CBS 2517 / CECT 1963 / NBRC 1671 / NRRL Y-8276) TaxID=1071382 RepID=H2AWJ9_KAZAF|nr:hypothetical protein KAFR_0F01520 [Kazachstania africana CBS 2517]CCF58749.1 hypothetical protein KAFR_0F01520 [Kazachstania africana CBS 2517]
MEGLIQVETIVRTIARNLDTGDYLNFKRINKLTYKDHLNNEFDDQYFTAKLRCLGLQRSELTNNNLVDNATITSINIFDEIKTFKEGNSLETFKIFYKTFNTYCNKLSNNNLSNFFSVKYDSDPYLQIVILQNIELYINSIRVNDFKSFTEIYNALNIYKNLFVTSCLNEMEIKYKNKEYDQVANFFKILFKANEDNVAIDFYNSKVEYPVVTDINPDTTSWDEMFLNLLFDPLRAFVNEQITLIDKLFDLNYPMVITFYENFVQQSLLNVINLLLNEEICTKDFFLEKFPQIYFKIIDKFCSTLTESRNSKLVDDKKSFRELLKNTLNVYLEPKILNYLNQSTTNFEQKLNNQFKNFQLEQKDDIIKNNLSSIGETQVSNSDSVENKNAFLNSFSKIFKLSKLSTKSTQTTSVSQLNDKLNSLVSKNFQTIKKFLNLELSFNIIQQTHDQIELFLKFKDTDSDSNLNLYINSSCENIFKILIDTLNENHIRPAFRNAIAVLENYNLDEMESIEQEKKEQSLEPLVNFAELINTGDIILQMISIFYKNEILRRKIISDDSSKEEHSNKAIFLQNNLIQAKKKLETTIDNFVANGLNIGINRLIDHIHHTFKTTQLPTDYYPGNKNELTLEIKPTLCCTKVISILDSHCFLLNGATDKGTIDVYQQEIGKRFFQTLVEHIKTQIISTEGAIFLICDMNQYYEFINKKLRQKSILPYFKALKNVGNLYLIDGKDSKELGKLIGDLSKFEGIFSQEEIYEFVQRRQDWLIVKRDVEKVMYGLGIKDCVVM